MRAAPAASPPTARSPSLPARAAVLGNTGRKGTITPADLPCCALAARPEKLARVLAFERPNGTLRTRADATQAAHHSYYLRVPTELIKRAKQTDGLGFAAALQGLVLWSLFRCEGAPSALHVACTVGFKSDFWARLGSAFNHYGAFPFAAADAPSPQALGRALARAQRRNGLVSGFACLLANASTGGLAIGGSMAKMYNAIGAPPHARARARRPVAARRPAQASALRAQTC